MPRTRNYRTILKHFNTGNRFLCDLLLALPYKLNLKPYQKPEPIVVRVEVVESEVPVEVHNVISCYSWLLSKHIHPEFSLNPKTFRCFLRNARIATKPL